MKTVLAGDLGGTKCRVALVAADLSVHAVEQLPTIRERAPFLAALDAAIGRVLANRPAGFDAPTAVGIGTAGVIPPQGGSIDYAPNLPLDGYPLAAHIERATGLPTTLCNDGRASAHGEYLRGHAQGADPLLCLFFGTGIGIGLIVDGRPFTGATNAAGEIGHTLYRPGGPPCPCGGRGHFESYCGGRAITEAALAQLGPHPTGAWTVGAVVAAAASRGTPQQAAAQAILAEAELAASILVANACTLWNPAAVVLGGGMLAGWPALAPALAKFVREHTRPRIHADLRFVPSLGGSDAILWGAAAATGHLPRR